LCSQVGFVLNLSKSFRSLDRGTFCEELYVHHEGHLRRVGTLPIRWLVPANRNSTLPILGVAETLTNFVSYGVSRNIVHKILVSLYSKELAFCRRAGLVPTLPVAFGGLGFPPVEPSRQLPLVIHRKVDAIATGATVSTPVLYLQCGPMLDRVARWQSRVKHRVTDNVDCPHLAKTLPSLRERAMASDACTGLLIKELSFHAVVRQCAKSWAKVPLARSPWDMNGKSYKWSSAYKLSRALRPTPESLWQNGHVCSHTDWVPPLFD